MLTYKILNSFTDSNKDIWENISLFEKQFTYPLGNEFFQIRHGRLSYYPMFFEKIGDYYKTIVIYEDDKIICTITGVVQNGIAYICDNKVSKNVKNKNKLLKDIFIKLNEELKINDRFYFINMSPPSKNPIIRLIENKFNYKLNIKPQYITTYTKKELDKNIYVGTNMGDKDIIINDNIYKLYHLNSGNIKIDDIEEDSHIMGISDTSINDTSIEITIASHNINIDQLIIPTTSWI